MTQTTHTTTATTIKLPAFALALTNQGEAGGLVALDYATNGRVAEEALHHEAAGRALEVMHAKAWHPADVIVTVLRLFSGNSPAHPLYWWESVDYFEADKLIRIATGKVNYTAPTSLAEVTPGPDLDGERADGAAEYQAANPPTHEQAEPGNGDGAGMSRGEWEAIRDGLQAVFGGE